MVEGERERHAHTHTHTTLIVKHVMRTTNYCSCHGLFICRWSFYSRGIRPNHERRKLLICVHTHTRAPHTHTHTHTHSYTYTHTHFIYTFAAHRTDTAAAAVGHTVSAAALEVYSGGGGRRWSRRGKQDARTYTQQEYNSHIARLFHHDYTS